MLLYYHLVGMFSFTETKAAENSATFAEQEWMNCAMMEKCSSQEWRSYQNMDHTSVVV